MWILLIGVILSVLASLAHSQQPDLAATFRDSVRRSREQERRLPHQPEMALPPPVHEEWHGPGEPPHQKWQLRVAMRVYMMRYERAKRMELVHKRAAHRAKLRKWRIARRKKPNLFFGNEP